MVTDIFLPSQRHGSSFRCPARLPDSVWHLCKCYSSFLLLFLVRGSSYEKRKAPEYYNCIPGRIIQIIRGTTRIEKWDILIFPLLRVTCAHVRTYFHIPVFQNHPARVQSVCSGSVPIIISFKQRSQSVTLYSCRCLMIRVSIYAFSVVHPWCTFLL